MSATTTGTAFAGRSESTPFKMELFDSLFEIELTATKQLRQKPWAHPEFFYVDLNAGVGRYSDGLAGSPLRFIDAAERTGQQARAVFCEAGERQLRSLRSAVPRDSRWAIMAGDHADHAEAIGETIRERSGTRTPFGLILADPNNTQVPVDAINTILRAAGPNRIDVAIHAPANAWKRAQRPLDERLPQILDAIDKQHSVVWDIYGKWEWMLSIHSNWEAFPALFRGNASEAVQAALRDRAHRTKAERSQSGAAEILRPKVPTARMRNTCDTQRIAVFERKLFDVPADIASDAGCAVQLRFTT